MYVSVIDAEDLSRRANGTANPSFSLRKKAKFRHRDERFNMTGVEGNEAWSEIIPKLTSLIPERLKFKEMNDLAPDNISHNCS
ncbi:hypothetical protein SDJN03_28218, partial [Cucurbita argyrosperma subsp. sororia]